MREYKFRGKSDDEWVYGMLVKVNEGDTEHREPFEYKIQTDEKEYGEYNNYFVTDNNTIGQYTGILDKNKKEIYEGDIVKDAWGINMLVKYINTGFYLCRKNTNGEYSKISNWRNLQTKEVIGNIYDNPELLKGE